MTTVKFGLRLTITVPSLRDHFCANSNAIEDAAAHIYVHGVMLKETIARTP